MWQWKEAKGWKEKTEFKENIEAVISSSYLVEIQVVNKQAEDQRTFL